MTSKKSRNSDEPIGKRKKRSEEHTSELQSQSNLVCRLLLEKKTHLVRYLPRLPPLIIGQPTPFLILIQIPAFAPPGFIAILYLLFQLLNPVVVRTFHVQWLL